MSCVLSRTQAESELAVKFSEIMKSPAERKAPVQLPAALAAPKPGGGPATISGAGGLQNRATTSLSCTKKSPAVLSKSTAAATAAAGAKNAAVDASGLQYEKCSNAASATTGSSASRKSPSDYVNSKPVEHAIKPLAARPSLQFVRSTSQTPACSNAAHHTVNQARLFDLNNV